MQISRIYANDVKLCERDESMQIRRKYAKSQIMQMSWIYAKGPNYADKLDLC